MKEGFIFSVGGGAALPVISFAAAAITAGAASGSAAGQASCSGGHSGAWSISTTAPLANNAITGAGYSTGQQPIGIITDMMSNDAIHAESLSDVTAAVTGRIGAVRAADPAVKIVGSCPIACAPE